MTMNRYFHAELEEIKNQLILIGEKANEAARIAVDGFLENDLAKIDKAISLDDEIDQIEQDIDRAAVRYITLRGPVSSDVRLIFVAIKASHDIERVGDEAHSIAKHAKKILTREGRLENYGTIQEMSEIACGMMSDAITCFVEQDIELARELIERDKRVDKLNRENFKAFAKKGDPNTDNVTDFEITLISRSIERIADHSTNLAEEVIYLLTGE